MLPKTLLSRIQQLGIVPPLVFIILIGCGLLGLYSDRLSQLEADRGKIGLNWLTDQSRLALATGNYTPLQSAVESLIEGLHIETAQVYGANHQLLATAGPKLQAAPEFFAGREQEVTMGHLLIISLPVLMPNNGTEPLGWALLSINTNISSATEHLGIIASMASVIISLALLALLAARLAREIHTPLHQIQATLEAFNNGRYSSRTPVDGCQELQRIAREINQLGSQLQASKLEVQQQINQATDDLQETLEALEVQNVQLDLARKEALQASRVKSEFLANTSHEIRTPINGIIGFTSLLFKTQLNVQQREYLRTIANSSQGLLTIINDILDFSRIESGKLTLDHAPLDLRQTIEETLQIVAPSAHEKHLQLVCLINHDMPLHFVGDALRFKQVLSNLVSNAIKFSSRGNIIVRAELLQQSGLRAEIKVSVSDSGIGIPEDKQKLIFEAFSQIDAANAREHSGTGLGLAIAKGLVERMEGNIGVNSQPGEGATFWFTVNLRITDNLLNHNHYTALQGIRIALLDTNPISRLEIEHLLEGWDALITTVDNDIDLPVRLAEAKEANTPLQALVVSTNAEDDEFRAEYLRHLIQMTRNHWHIPVLLITQPETLYDQHQGLSLAATSVISKPVTHDRLYYGLCEHIGLSAPISSGQMIAIEPRKGRAPNILAVDDNPANLQLVTEFLQQLGATVTQANNGREALDCCEQSRFDLIFMDIQMPGLDGLATTKLLRAKEKDGKRTPVIALTAHAMNEQKSELLLAGLDDYTTKPVSEAQLAHILNRWLESDGGRFEPTPSPPDTEVPPSSPTGAEVKSLFDIMDLSESLRLANYKPRLAKDMLEMLLGSLDDDKQKIRSYYAAEDWEQLEYRVHRLHGGCCYCGVPELRNASDLVDKLLQKRYLTELKEPIANLLGAIDTLQNWEREHDLDSLFGDDQSIV